MERCLGLLDRISHELINRLALQEYSQREAADMMGFSQSQIGRSYDEALDFLSSMLLERGLMRADE